MEILSNTKHIDIAVPLNSGVTADNEDVRFELPSGGELRYVIKKHFIDSMGNPCRAGASLYRTKNNDQLPGESVFRCRGCHFFYSLTEGHEIMDPPPEVIQMPNSPDDAQDDGGNILALRVPQENRPRSAFCDICWKHEKRARLIRAVVSFFFGPFRSMMVKASTPVPTQNSPAPVILLPGQPRSQQSPGRGRNMPPNQRGNP